MGKPVQVFKKTSGVYPKFVGEISPQQRNGKNGSASSQGSAGTWKGTPRRHKYTQFFNGQRVN